MDNQVKQTQIDSQVAEHLAVMSMGIADDAEWHVSGQIALDYLGLSPEDMKEITEDALTQLEEIRAYRG